MVHHDADLPRAHAPLGRVAVARTDGPILSVERAQRFAARQLKKAEMRTIEPGIPDEARRHADSKALVVALCKQPDGAAVTLYHVPPERDSAR